MTKLEEEEDKEEEEEADQAGEAPDWTNRGVAVDSLWSPSSLLILTSDL